MKQPGKHRVVITWIMAIILMIASKTLADEIRVAVASNFSEVIKILAERFEKSTGHQVILSFGSTGKHYAQIRNGAPFDVFLAADERRPKLLEQEGIALPGSRFTYAIGKLILWSPRKGYIDSAGAVLKQGTFRYLAIANPKLAPYGKAAREVLQALGLWKALAQQMVRGENIGQAFQYIKSGNADLGFVAYSQVKKPGLPIEGSCWEVPQELYTPIRQQAVLLKENAAAQAFLSFMQSDAALTIIQSYGYETP